MIIPEENVPDLKEIPDNVKADLDIKPVAWIDQVFDVALTYLPEPLSRKKGQIVQTENTQLKNTQKRINRLFRPVSLGITGILEQGVASKQESRRCYDIKKN